MKTILFICLSLLVSQSFAVPVVQFPILPAHDFMIKKPKNTTANNQKSTPPNTLNTTSTMSEPKPPENLISLQKEHVIPVTSSLHVQQTPSKTAH